MDKPRNIRWEDLKAIHDMQTGGRREGVDKEVQQHARLIRAEMKHEMYQIMYDVLKGRQP